MIIKCPECGQEVSDKAECCPHCGVTIAGKKEVKSRRWMWITLVVFLLLIAMTVAGVYLFYQYTQQQSELTAYENAIKSNEQAILQNFLDIYTEAPKEHRDSVRAHIEALRLIDQEWTNVVRSQSKTALMRYIQLHPESIHVTEARLLVDSIDWALATAANTLEAYKGYIQNHQDGLHYDEARLCLDQLNSRVVTPGEQEMISKLFTTYFNSLAKDDESGLLGTLGAVIHTFFNRQNVTKDEVVNYMRKLHESADILGMSFLLNNDWKIDKIENEDTGELEYVVTFTVDQRIDRSDPDGERLATYRVSGKVSPEGRIVDLNMKKVAKN